MKSKTFKYKIEQSNLEYPLWRIKFKERGLFSFLLHWIPIHGIFKTEDEAKREVEMYIKDDNENLK